MRATETTIFAGFRLLLADQIEEAEQRRPENEEVQQRLLQQAFHGVYQIGEV